jgi:hypothetical protein
MRARESLAPEAGDIPRTTPALLRANEAVRGDRLAFVTGASELDFRHLEARNR